MTCKGVTRSRRGSKTTVAAGTTVCVVWPVKTCTRARDDNFEDPGTRVRQGTAVGSIGETKSDEATAFNHDLVILAMRSRITLQL